MTVLDASAVIAVLKNERGHEKAAAAFDEAILSTVNLAEVLGWGALNGSDPTILLADLAATAITIVPLSAEEALLVATLLPATAPRGLSFGDRACLATAMIRGLPVLTADRAWEGLDVGVPIEMVR